MVDLSPHLRLVVVLEDLFDTGANRVSLDRARHWQARGDDVTVFVAAGVHPATVPVPDGLTVVPGANGGRLLTYLPVALLRLLRLVGGADVVVAGTEVGFGLLLAWSAATLRRRPFAVTVQSAVGPAVENYVEPRLRRVTRAALRHADLLVCVARGLVASTVPSSASAARVVAAPNAVDRPAVRAAAACEPSTAWDHELPLVVGVGRLAHQKGFDQLVRAHALALAGGAAPHQLMLVGDGDDRASLEQLVRELDVEGSVVFAGFLDNPHAVVSRASAFVLSSRWEGFSLCLAEALACGTACIAFDCVAGPDEVLAGGTYGLLLPPQDVAALADALRAHLDDPAALSGRARLAASGELAIFDPQASAEVHRSELAGLRR